MENKVIKFEELNLSENMKRALKDVGYVNSTPIQAQSIPYILEGRDLIGQSQTGTGKTASYSIPLIEKIEPELKKVQAMVICPTRELAMQVAEEIRKFTKYKEGIKCVAIYGGESIERQIKALKSGAKIVIGTPGRIMDHIRRKTLKLQNIKMVVLDEADEMLNMGFEDDIETILKEVPEERQTILFSATINKRIKEVANKYLKNPVDVKIKFKELTVDKIEQYSVEIKGAMKNEALIKLIDVNAPKKAVVFCNTKKKVDDLIEILKNRGYKAESLHGDIKQVQRERIMKRFKNGEFQILVATDVIARGIDVDELELVVNYDVPQEEEYYVHRIGRTGRNGKNGKAYTLVVGKEKNKMFDIQKYAKTKILSAKVPTDKEIREVKKQKTVLEIQEIINNDNIENTDMNSEILEELLKENDARQVAMALLQKFYGQNENNNSPVINIGDSKIIKLFFNLGKKDNIKTKDIVGSIAANTAISSSDIGKINVLDKFSFVEVPNEYAQQVMNGMKNKTIKGKNVNIEIANS